MERGEGGRRVLSHPHRPPLRIGGEKVFSQTFFFDFFSARSPGMTPTEIQDPLLPLLPL